mmetsp:Transcript_1110/g.2534  ORF Transcript_1110/g.2534 Transcript_1110/m.2534 type:complete len:301 (+) Transcript_1110:953-1855(+)
MSLPPAGAGFCVVPLLPLNEAILLALLAPVHDLCQRVHVSHPSVLQQLLLPVGCQDPGPGVELGKHLLSRLFSKLIHSVANAPEDHQIILICNDLFKALLLLLGLFQQGAQNIGGDAVLQNRGYQPPHLRRAILQQFSQQRSFLVHVLYLLELLQPNLAAAVPVLLRAQQRLVEGLARGVVPELGVVLVPVQVRVVPGVRTVQLQLLFLPLLIPEFRIQLGVAQLLVLLVRDPGWRHACCLLFGQPCHCGLERTLRLCLGCSDCLTCLLGPLHVPACVLRGLASNGCQLSRGLLVKGRAS